MTSSFLKITGRGTWRATSVAGIAIIVASCSSGGNSVWPEFYETAKRTVQGGDSPSLFEQAKSNPYASMGVKLQDDDEQVLVLALETSESRLWTSAAKIVLVTRNGRIIRSSGLAYNVAATHFITDDPLTKAKARYSSTGEITHIVDFYDINEFSVPVHCRIKARGASPVTILGKSIATDRVDEVCSCPELDWSYTNSFWIGEDGFVWKAVQYIHPKLGPIETEILRPPANAALLEKPAQKN